MLGWDPLLTSWLNTLPPTFTESLRELIVSLYHRMVPSSLDFVRKSGFKVGTILIISIKHSFLLEGTVLAAKVDRVFS